MKILLVALLALAGSLAHASDEQYISQNVNLEMRGPNQVLPVLRTLMVPPQARINNLIIVAATRAGRGSLEVQMDGVTIFQRQVGSSLEALQVALNGQVGVTFRTLQIVTSGMFQIAHIGLGIQSSGPGPGPGPGPVPPPRGEEVTFTESVEGMAYATSTPNARNLAQSSYEQRCSQWKDEMYRMAGNRLRYVQCGEPTDVGGSNGYKFRSDGKVIVLSYGSRQNFKSVLVGGPVATSTTNARNLAFSDYQARCDAFKAEAAELNPGRLVFVSCGPATDVGGSGSYQFRSEASLVVSNSGATETVSETIRGFSARTSETNARALAMQSFETRCEEWKSDMRRFQQGRIIMLSCGEPTDVGGSNAYQFQSSAFAVLSQN